MSDSWNTTKACHMTVYLTNHLATIITIIIIIKQTLQAQINRKETSQMCRKK